MAIPKLTAAHIQKALRSIDRDGVPPRRESTRFYLEVGGNSAATSPQHRYPEYLALALGVPENGGTHRADVRAGIGCHVVWVNPGNHWLRSWRVPGRGLAGTFVMLGSRSDKKGDNNGGNN